MRKLLMGMAVLALLAVAGKSDAANGTINMTWDTGVGAIDKTGAPGGAGITYEIFMSVLGIDQLHKAYDVRMIYGDASQNVPDAWRFDAVGCEGSSLVTLDHLPPAAVSKACPAFMQTSAPSLQIKDVSLSPNTDPYATTLMRCVLANSYPNGVATINPATRYFLAGFKFDFTFGVTGPSDPGNTCGGMETPVCFKMSNSRWLDLNGIESAFDRASAAISVSWQGAGACAAVPARPATWGQLKNQYHN